MDSVAVAGLVAAVVTLIAGFWWQARTRRQTALEDAAAAMAAEADALAGLVLLSTPDGSVLMGMMSAIARAGALAGRHVGPFEARRLAPARWGFALTLDDLGKDFSSLVAVAATGAPGSEKDLAFGLATISAAGVRWLRDPLSFRGGSIGENLREAVAAKRAA